MFLRGGYDNGYEACPCFWGTKPGSLISLLEKHISKWNDLRILDLGCGEGKNAIHLARLGATVQAIDISNQAISNAQQAWRDKELVMWQVCDIRHLDFGNNQYDIVVLYGLLHCLTEQNEITQMVEQLQKATKSGGYHVVCAFNDRSQDLSAHPNFLPTLLSHDFYLNLYNNWEILYDTDRDLKESHPNNNIEHVHSMTRLISHKV